MKKNATKKSVEYNPMTLQTQVSNLLHFLSLDAFMSRYDRK